MLFISWWFSFPMEIRAMRKHRANKNANETHTKNQNNIIHNTVALCCIFISTAVTESSTTTTTTNTREKTAKHFVCITCNVCVWLKWKLIQRKQISFQRASVCVCVLFCFAFKMIQLDADSEMGEHFIFILCMSIVLNLDEPMPISYARETRNEIDVETLHPYNICISRLKLDRLWNLLRFPPSQQQKKTTHTHLIQ